MQRRQLLGLVAAAATAGCGRLRKAFVGRALGQTVFKNFAHEDGALVVELNDDPEMDGAPPAKFTAEGPITSRYEWPHEGKTTYEVTAGDLGSEFMAGPYTVTAYANADGSGTSHEVKVNLSQSGDGYDAKVKEVTVEGGL